MTKSIVALSSMYVYKSFGRIVGTEKSDPENEIITEASEVRGNLFIFQHVEARGKYEKILYEQENY
ncbi:hypothetical protein [Bacillus sp. T33-2]|uniref:hypothetical protein n=1 Tax=Bacillus sp. T33-2 TaxID=2054168 RepID=UPI00115C1843|nr:hypothetical protein [Bacillus sp. T33-2]